MIWFDAAPAIPLSDPRLALFNKDEIALAEKAGYVGLEADPALPVRRRGLDNCMEAGPEDDLADWRARLYVVWFCYIYENFNLVAKPLYAIEELILEFKAVDLIDLPGSRLATGYAGAGGNEPVSRELRQRTREDLEPHYAKALQLLAAFAASG